MEVGEEEGTELGEEESIGVGEENPNASLH